MLSGLSRRRYWLLIAAVTALFFLVFYQLYQLHVLRRDSILNIAERQHQLKIEIPPHRGQILDRGGKELAISLKVPSIFAVPRTIPHHHKEQLAKQVSEILGLKKEFVLERLYRDKAFIWLKRKVTLEEAKKIRALKTSAFGIVDEYKRFYPNGHHLAQVLGIVNIDNQGMEGIEFTLNEELQGRAGVRYTKRDALGREIKALEKKTIPSLDGNKIYLTIDQHIQYLAERSLDKAFKKWNAKAASAVVMEAKTGKIVAIVNRPTFDPNDFSKSNMEMRRNRAVTDMYEPGSIFKIVPAGAVLNEGKATTQQMFFCENGEYHYGSHTLHDVHAYGRLSFEEIIVKSSNIGTVKIAALLKPDIFQKYIRDFGFGEKTGIDLPGEASGFTNPPHRWSKTSPYNIPMGHEILVTLMQMASAMAVVANGGDLVTPYIVDRIEDQNGVVLKQRNPEIQGKVLSPETSKRMREILVRVVEEGTGKNAKIKGVSVGGKTGTAQKVLPDGKGYSHDDFMSSFVGFAPAEDPMLVMAVVLDDPGPKYYGGTVAAPVFKEVMEAGLLTLGYVPQGSQIFEPYAPPLQDVPESPPIILAA